MFTLVKSSLESRSDDLLFFFGDLRSILSDSERSASLDFLDLTLDLSEVTQPLSEVFSLGNSDVLDFILGAESLDELEVLSL